MSEVVIGLVADTHVPDRVLNLHPGLLPALREAGVTRILHAGDICDPAVLDELADIAPVTAVQGNRDLLLNGSRLPKTAALEVHGVRIGLLHGFGDVRRYLAEKLHYLLRGYQLAWYRNLALKSFPDADVLIFGHTHRPENVLIDNQLFVNPGSAGVGGRNYPPSCGILRVSENGSFSAEIINLQGAEVENRRWVGVQGG